MLRFVSLLLLAAFPVAQAMVGKCWICSSPNRYFMDSSILDVQFQAGDGGDTMTCNRLKEIFEEDEDGDDYYFGETICRIAQAHAEANCRCGPTPLHLPAIENPSCSLCGDPNVSVPNNKKKKVVWAEIEGYQNVGIECGPWESAGRDLGFTPQQCSDLVRTAAGPCGCPNAQFFHNGGNSVPVSQVKNTNNNGGASCTSGSQCDSGVCDGGKCTDGEPRNKGGGSGSGGAAGDCTGGASNCGRKLRGSAQHEELEEQQPQEA